RGQTASVGQGNARSLRGRRGAFLRARGGCTQGDGRAAEAVRQVRFEPASRENPARRISPTGQAPPSRDLFLGTSGGRRPVQRNLRPSGLHALLGQVAPRQV